MQCNASLQLAIDNEPLRPFEKALNAHFPSGRSTGRGGPDWRDLQTRMVNIGVDREAQCLAQMRE